MSRVRVRLGLKSIVTFVNAKHITPVMHSIRLKESENVLDQARLDPLACMAVASLAFGDIKG